MTEHSKTEVFHFNRSHRSFNPPFFDLSSIGGPILCPKNSWKYLGFIFDQKLMFYQHIDFYLNKAISMVKCMRLIGNSSQGLSRNDFYTGVASFPSRCTDSNCGFTIGPLYRIPWKSLEKYREGLLSEFWEPSKLHLWIVKIIDGELYFIFSFYFILLYFTFSFSFFYF